MLKFFQRKKKFDIEAFIAGSVQGMEHVIAAHKEAWRFGQEKAWKVDEAAGRLSFCFDDGTVVSAPFQVVGTLDAGSKSFTWGWHHPAVAPALRRDAERVKAFGEQWGAKEFIEPKVPHCTEKRAWEYAALAMLLAEANGTYRVPVAPGTSAFVTFGAVTIAPSEKKPA